MCGAAEPRVGWWAGPGDLSPSERQQAGLKAKPHGWGGGNWKSGGGAVVRMGIVRAVLRTNDKWRDKLMGGGDTCLGPMLNLVGGEEIPRVGQKP